MSTAPESGPETEAPASVDVTHVAPNRFIWWLTRIPLFIALACALAGVFESPRFFIGVFHPLIFGIVFSLLARVRNPWPSRNETQAKLWPEGIEIGGELVPRGTVRDGFALPLASGATRVRLVRGVRDPVEIETKDAAGADRILEHLGLDVGHHRTSFRLMHPRFLTGRYIFALVGAMVALMASAGFLAAALHTPAIVPIPALFISVLAMLPLILPLRMTIGADGVLVTFARSTRLITYDDIIEVRSFEQYTGGKTYLGIEIVTRTGEPVRGFVGQRGWQNDKGKLIAARIEQARAKHAAGGNVSAEATLGRGARSTADWAKWLLSMGAGGQADHRHAAIEGDELLRIVEDPQARSTTRIAAAVALRSQLDERDRNRLRIAAEATAAPKLRFALDVASREEHDESALLEALEDVEKEEEMLAK